ncbi:hypothetical protein KL905_002019 [Ogataea polymorpha]|nr:hypothetical protein KL937_001962 [Ogataea polymorpha]KAG7901476.1 hypothetical protein KL935_002542 [Ogataea polymorpha]KAG7917251.1 hypothetical protein KL927_003025 [Ogataea polymorpha]KAG7921997.1 hypothetical protein KL905_002019 [Ogataea polymorpha]KAG7936912.1 hypothetical protein KL904_002480 [Ogataea polymorpha]
MIYTVLTLRIPQPRYMVFLTLKNRKFKSKESSLFVESSLSCRRYSHFPLRYTGQLMSSTFKLQDNIDFHISKIKNPLKKKSVPYGQGSTSATISMVLRTINAAVVM